MRKTKGQLYLVKTYVRARNAKEAQKLAKTIEAHEILLQAVPERHREFVDAVGYLETAPEWEEEDVPDEYCVGYKKPA